MIAVKGNRRYRIREEERENRRADGYDIYDDEGNLVAYSALKTVPWEQYAALAAKCAALEEQVKKLKAKKKEA